MPDTNRVILCLNKHWRIAALGILLMHFVVMGYINHVHFVELKQHITAENSKALKRSVQKKIFYQNKKMPKEPATLAPEHALSSGASAPEREHK